MEITNQTSYTRFILLGLSNDPRLQVFSFLVFLLMYIMTLSGNLLLILAVRVNPTLQTPMYFFLSNLSAVDIIFSSTVVPKILINALSKDRSISLLECAVQMYVHLAMGACESILLAVMAFDRYAAICRPLHYNAVMNKKLCIGFAAMAWSVGSLNSFILVIPTLSLPICRSNHIDHFFCEIPPFLQMSCGDTWANVLLIYISAGVIVMCSFLLTLVSYCHIIYSILNIRNAQGRYKTFSTCASHLSVVTVYYGAIMFMCMRPPTARSSRIDKGVPVVYTAVTPLLNPFVYSMRNKDVKETSKTFPLTDLQNLSMLS
ncbi:PREDICTED: olfactory receptor 5V1-like [Nanorana parkeri]|uniref:olfactory receptor 5V1-like n=1 Tax=Nanorana parkeri TaxID=125878 RepID=UPI000853F323|nr:PREDICTED: olfactory receptor 5V1-like [Nanorana parkeri]